MPELYYGKGLFFITEQRLFDQANNIRKRGWLTEIELGEIDSKKLSFIMAKRTIMILIMLHPKGQVLLPCLKNNRLFNR